MHAGRWPYFAILLVTGCPQPRAVETPVTEHVTEVVTRPVGPLADADAAFDQHDWERAAIAYAKRAHDPALPPAAVPLAEQRLAECLHHLGLPRSSSVIFRDVAGKDGEAARASFRWLARISVELKQADLSSALGRFPEASRAAALADLEPEARSRGHYMLGRELRSQGKLEEAIAALERVDGDDAGNAQIMIALVHVQRRLSVPAAAALGLVAQKAASKKRDQDRVRLRELASLLEAQIYYSASALSHAGKPKTVVVDRKKLLHAAELFDSIPRSSELYADARWQGAWARFALGELPAARSGIEAALATPDAYFPEAELLAADVEWRLREDAKARASLSRFTARYGPVVEGLAAQEKQLRESPDAGAKALALLAGVRAAPRDLPAPIATALVHVLRDRLISSHLDDMRLAEAERAAISKLSKELQDSEAGSYARAAADTYVEEQRRWLSFVVQERIARAREELAALLSSAESAKRVAGGKGNP